MASIRGALARTRDLADERISAADRMFLPFAEHADSLIKQIRGDGKNAAYLAHFDAFRDALAKLTTIHYSGLVSDAGSSPSKTTSSATRAATPGLNLSKASATPATPALPLAKASIPEKPASSYAAIASRPASNPWVTVPSRQQKAKTAVSGPAKAPSTRPKTAKPDTRIFVRLPTTHAFRSQEAFVTHQIFRKSFPEIFLDKILPVKSGLALFPSDARSAKALTENASDKVSQFFGSDASVERPEKVNSFVVSLVPSRVPTPNFASGQVEHHTTTASMVAEQIKASHGISVHHCSEKNASPEANQLTKSFFVHVKATERPRMPRNLSLFGKQALASRLAERQRLPQCNKCFGWHNERICGRASICAHCGSEHHLTTAHKNSCSTSSAGHKCPDKCVNCLGPHRADDPRCPSRPHKDRPALTRAQKGALRAHGNDSRSRACVLAGCRAKQDSPAPPSAPSTPTRNAQDGPCHPARRPRHAKVANIPADTSMEICSAANSPAPGDGSPNAPSLVLGVTLMSYYASTRTYKPAKILQINVGRCNAAQHIALENAHSRRVDVVLIQEPSIHFEIDRRLTARHPSYATFIPPSTWDTAPPRVVTYVRKGAGLRAEQVALEDSPSQGSRDILSIRMTSGSTRHLIITNVYNAPLGCQGAGAAARVLLEAEPHCLQARHLIAGDFNMIHSKWQPTFIGTPHPDTRIFVEWLERHSLILLSDEGAATHRRGNSLDLCFASTALFNDGPECEIVNDLDVTSDHHPLVSTVPWCSRLPASPPRLKLSSLDPVIFEHALSLRCPALTALPRSATPENLDNLANVILSVIQQAMDQSAPRLGATRASQPWFDKECRAACKSLNRHRRAHPTEEDVLKDLRRTARNTLRRRRRAYYQAQLCNAQTPKDVFRLTKIHKSTGDYQSPPLCNPAIPGSPPAYSTSDKRLIFQNTLLTNESSCGDISFDCPAVARSNLPFPKISTQEVRDAIFKTGNTAPGADGITSAILQTAWPIVGGFIERLFAGCLRTGYHPRAFKEAVLVLVKKPKKSDLSNPRSYRPIALLSTLGKALERLVARRMSWIAVKSKVLAHSQFGAVPLRSAVDLTTCLTHDTERILHHKYAASLLTLDVKGAFDAVLPGRLARRLREQGWPLNVVKWVTSFTSQRRVRIRLDGDLGDSSETRCGLPQGSPVSPILFMLFISPLLRVPPPELGQIRTFGYADDIAMLAHSSSHITNCQILSDQVERALEWGAAEGISFDLDKSELLHFTRSRRPLALNELSIKIGDYTVTPAEPKKGLKWLGVRFDSKLTFRSHIHDLCGKATKVAHALKSLGNTIRGVRANYLRQAVLACVLPVALYASETWWPGLCRPGRIQRRNINSPSRDSRSSPSDVNVNVSNRVIAHVKEIEKVLRACALAILPVYKTFPTISALREAGIAPATSLLDHHVRRFAARTRRLDPDHPLSSRAAHLTRHPELAGMTRFARAILALPDSQRVDPIRYPPWTAREDRKTALARLRAAPSLANQAPLCSHPPEIAFASNDVHLHTDGSKCEGPDGYAGAGYVAYIGREQIFAGSVPLGRESEVFDAEVIAAVAGLGAALRSELARSAPNIVVFLDNQEVALNLRKTWTGSSQGMFEEFRRSAIRWTRRRRPTAVARGEVRVRWVKGHSGIPGNEAADQLAKSATRETINGNFPYKRSLASLNRLVSAEYDSSRISSWTSSAGNKYRELGIDTAPRCPPELFLERRVLGYLLACRSGHGDFAQYHVRFNHPDAELNCRCGSAKSRVHLFFCSIARRRYGKPLGSASVDFFLGGIRKSRPFQELLLKTDFLALALRGNTPVLP